MPTKYDPKAIEHGRYKWWIDGKFFEATNDKEKEPYTIVIPPPNVTGKLHLGHAWDTALQDILTQHEAHAGLRRPLASGNGPRGDRDTGKSR